MANRNQALDNSQAIDLLASAQLDLSLAQGNLRPDGAVLAAAGLLIESIVRLASVPLGFRSDHLLTAEVALPPQAYSQLNQRSSLYARLITELSVLPSVEGVALCSALPPYNGGGSSELAVAGKAPIENRLLSKICGLIPVPGVSRACDIRPFPSHQTYESQTIVWSPLEFCC